MAVRFDAILGKLLTKYVKTTGDTMTGALGIGIGTPRAGSVFDVVSTGTGTIGNVASGSLTFSYGTGNYYNESLYFEFRIYSYRVFGGTTVYSSSYRTISGTDNGNSDSVYSIQLNWGTVQGADGYRVIVMSDSYAGASGNYYFDIAGNKATIGPTAAGFVEEVGDNYIYSASPTVTPTSATTGSDTYISNMGDVYSTNDFYFGNLPSLSLGNDNGLTLTGINAQTLSLSTTGRVILGGLSLKSGRTPGSSQLVFPQGAGGSAAPGIRFEGGTTEGGLAMNDGILEFWNNFSQYCTPVSGRPSYVFRLDTRAGYESDGFLIGGSLANGTGFGALSINYSNGDTNLSYYGYGAVGVGWDTNSLGIYGKNGWMGVRYTAKIGGGLILGYVAKTSNYTITETDYTVNCTANSFTITLPSATTWTGQTYNIKNSGNGVITINTTSSQTIDGNASGVLKLNQYDNLTVQSNGANWLIL